MRSPASRSGCDSRSPLRPNETGTPLGRDRKVDRVHFASLRGRHCTPSTPWTPYSSGRVLSGCASIRRSPSRLSARCMQRMSWELHVASSTLVVRAPVPGRGRSSAVEQCLHSPCRCSCRVGPGSGAFLLQRGRGGCNSRRRLRGECREDHVRTPSVRLRSAPSFSTDCVRSETIVALRTLPT